MKNAQLTNIPMGGGAKARLISQIDGLPRRKPNFDYRIDALRFYGIVGATSEPQMPQNKKECL